MNYVTYEEPLKGKIFTENQMEELSEIQQEV